MDRKKRIISNLLCLMFVLCSVFTFTSCGKECKHDWGEWQTVTQSTCTSTGTKKRQCSKCEEFEEDIIQISNHTFGEWNEEVPATCSSTGTKAHKYCSVCEKNYDANGNEIADLTLAVNTEAHSYGEWTSNGNGTHTRVCANNSEHTETKDCAGGEATCEEKAVCSDCEEEYGNFANHTFGEWNEEVPATCSSTGTKAHKDCSVCEKHFDENDEEIIDLTIEIDEDAHNMTTKVVAPTCSEQGYTIHYCQNEPCEYSYNDTYVEANDHSWDGEATCTEGIGCLNCDETKPELGHNHELKETVEASCETGGYEYYKCSRCDDDYTIPISEEKGHNITGVTPTELHLEDCKYQYVYKCSVNNCGKDVYGDIFYKHTFKATIDTEATCTKAGLKILTCESCGHSEEEVIKINENGHIWDEGTLDTITNIRTFHCINKDDENNSCSASYTAIDASNTNSAGVSSSDLTLAGGGVKLESAELEFDNTALGALENKDLIISSEILSGEDLETALNKLTPEEREQLSTVAGNDPVIYNFTVAESENPDDLIETFNDGFVTVRLPYTPDDEDIDSVAVWYISGGKPVAIEAAYSNGYITFKTNHFSEYTVTRLLPEERCALYGCVNKETVFEGTCTQDAYIFKICIRCHKSEKTITKVATGHIYSEIETPATCEVDGKIVFECDNCEYHYTKLLPKLGHRYEETENHEATCEEVGKIIYTCQNDNCDKERIITIPQLSHNITETYYQPTCETDGYMISKCESCSYEIKVITGKATGHQFVSKFVWADDYSSAKLVFTCSKNNTHIVEKDAEIEKTITPATCTSNEITTYTAIVNIDGVQYKDTKEAIGDKLDHTYLDEWHYNDSMHWKECECSAKDSLANHILNDGVVINEPTCTEKGKIKYTCECGYEKFEDIDPTYEHTYENGICTGCGKADDACDHSELTEVKVNLEDYGACEGIFVYKICSCGEVCLVDDKAFYQLTCNMDDMEDDYGTDEDGNMYMIVKGSCPDCGLYVEMISYPKQNGCETHVKNYYTFVKDDITILENAYSEATYESHISSNKTLSLKEYSDCGSSIEVFICGDCGKITDVISMEGVKCNVDYDQYTGVDENGNNYGVYLMTCTDCGLVFTSKFTEEIISSCESIIYNEMTISKDGTILYSCIEEEYEDNHNYEISYEKLGESCDDGVEIYKKCLTCGEEDTYIAYGHGDTTEKYIKLSEYGCCDSKIVVEECTVCGEFIHLIGSESSCEMYNKYTEKYLDSNNVEHTLYTNECRICGLKVSEDSYISEVDGCNVTSVVTFSYIMDDKVIFEFTRFVSSDIHNLSYTYVDDDNDCETGYTIIAECSNCGMSYNMQGFGHQYTKEEITFEDKDCCDTSIIYETCEICHLESNINNIEFNFNCKFNEVFNEYEDDLGIVHYTMTSTCEECGLVMVSENYFVQKSDCVSEVHYIITITLNNEVLFNKDFVETEAFHDYTNSYLVEEGKNCEDGYKYIMTCKNCGDTITETGYGHVYQWAEEYYTKDGTCGITLHLEKCIICNHISNVNLDNAELDCMPSDPEYDFEPKEIVDDEGNTHYVTEFTCGNCQRVYILDVWAKSLSNCIYEYNQSLIIVDGSEIIFETTITGTREDHDLEITYTFYSYDNDCDKGYSVSEKCKNCDYANYYDGYGHDEEWSKEELSNYGLCGGEIYKSECKICHKVLNQNVNDYCLWQLIENNENDEEVYYCENCNTYKSVGRVESEKDKNCNYTITYTYTYYLEDGTELLKIEQIDTYSEHNYKYNATLHGTTCEEGVTVIARCEDCGYEENYESFDHKTILETNYSFNDYENVCGGEVIVSKCPCGLISNYTTHNLLCELHYYDSYGEEDENGIWHEYSLYRCSTCNLVQMIESYYDVDGCKKTNCNKVAFALINENSEESTILLELNIVRDIYFEHDYVVENITLFGKTCEDGYIVYQECSHCGESVEYESYNHEQYKTVLIDLEEQGACGGELIKYACPCDFYRNIELKLDCNYRVVDNSYNQDGLDHTVTIYICEKCGIQIENDKYTVIENCVAKDTTNIIVTLGENVVYTTTFVSSGYDHHDYEYIYNLFDESCDDGYEVIQKCKNCDASESYYGSGHELHTDSEYKLSDYGCCEGKITILSCACKMCSEVRYFEYSSCQFEYDYSNEEIDGVYYNITTITCAKCNLIIRCTNYDMKEGCKVFNCNEYTISVNDTIIVEKLITKYYSYDSHDESVNYVLHGENCEDGVTLTFACKDCGQTREEIVNYHYEIIYEEYDLSEYSSCGGTLSFIKCPCEKYHTVNKYFNYDESVYSHYVDEDGNYHNVESLTCNLCGLRYEDDSCVVYDKENCLETTHHNIYLVVGSFANQIEYSYSATRHSFITTAEFLSSVKNCENGVELTHSCKYCDYTYKETIYYHYEYDFEVINLNNYGSVCDGYATYRSCACGHNGSMNLEYAICEFEQNSISMWFDNYIKNEYNREYGAYVYTCSVTDPVQCGFKIRYAYYYVRYDNLCYDIKYERWQFGYNELTDTFEYEVIYEIGRDTNHKYVDNNETIQNDDGYVEINEHLCKNCGIGNINKYYYNSSNLLYKEEIYNYDIYDYANNIMSTSYNVYEYLYRENSKGEMIKYPTRDYYEYLVGSEKQNYNETIYEYDFTFEASFGTDSYKVYETYSNNYGDTRESEKHKTYYEYKYRYRFGNYDWYDNKNWFTLYEYHIYNKGTSNESWNSVERSYRFDIATDYGVSAHEITKTERGTYVDPNTVTFAEFYYTKENDTDNDSGWYTLHLYRIYNAGTDYESYNYENYSYDFDYNVPFGNRGKSETKHYRDSEGANFKESYASSTVYSEYHGYDYYVYYFYRYYIEFEGTENEYWHRYDYTYSFDTGCKQTTTFTDSLGSKTEETIDFHKNLIRASTNIKDPTCTQIGIGSRVCEICKFHQEEFEIEPTCHNWIYSYDDYKYHCEDCGLVNMNGASGEIVMEDYTEEYGNDTHYVVGYYIKNNVDFTYYIGLVNPSTYEEIILTDLSFVDYAEFGIVAIGVNKEEIRLTAESLGYNVDNYLIKFSFVPIGADSTLDYAITFGDITQDEDSESYAYIDSTGNVVVNGIVIGVFADGNIIDSEGNIVGIIDSTGNIIDNDGEVLGNINFNYKFNGDVNLNF